MITASRKRFETTKPYILEKERDTDNPTIWGLRLLAPEENADFMNQFQLCMEKKGRTQQENLNSERYVATVNKKIIAGLAYIENIMYEDEHIGELKLDDDEGRDKARKILRVLDEDERTELLTAVGDETTLSEGVKKN